MHYLRRILRHDNKKLLVKIIRQNHQWEQDRGIILVTPSSSLVTDRVKITGTGFTPFSPITIKTRVQCDEEDIRFSSQGCYVTNDDGSFDINQSASSGGTYTGSDGMGLFWSMKTEEGDINRFQMTDASCVLNYEFSVLEGHVDGNNDAREICKASHKRSYLADGVKRVEIRKPGVTGTLFVPPGNGPFPAVMTLYGGLKSRKLIEDASAIFANQGFVSLTLAYFGFEGLPRFYSKAPLRLELFEKGFDYLSSLRYVDSNALGVYGISKGGELAVALASLLPQVKAAVCANGSVVSTWSDTYYKDHHFHRIGFDKNGFRKLPDGSYVTRDGCRPFDATSPSTYPFQNSDAQMLMICGLDDQSIPQEILGAFFKHTMKQHGKNNFEVAEYEGLGHLIDAPYVPPCTLYPHSLLNNNNLYYGGGDIEVHSKQVVRVWDKVTGFFKQHLT